MNRKDYLLLAGILFLHLLLLYILKFTAWPEMSLWPYLITKGWLPYKDIAIVHTPLMILDLTLFYKIFGVGIVQLKIFTWILIILSDLLVFLVVEKIWGKKTAFLSLTFYVLLVLFYDGNGLWFDLYMGVLAFCSFYLIRTKQWFWAGIFWALAFLSKQTAIWFLIPIIFQIVKGYRFKIADLRKILRGFAFGAGAVFLFFILLSMIFNLLPSFWNWAVKFGIFELPRTSGQVQFPSLRNLAAALFPFLLFVPLFLNHKSKFLDLALWALAGVLGAYPRFEYFHFQPALPYLALALGVTVLEVEKKKRLRKILIIYLVGFGALFAVFLDKNLGKETRFYESEVREVVNYVRQNSQPEEKILVMNWWDNIYAFTETLPAINPWVPQLPWYQELPSVQKEEINDLEDVKPRLILLYPYSQSGLSAYVPAELYDFVLSNYEFEKKIGVIDILVPKK